MGIEIKIKCSCGTHYAFEVEPETREMPCTVQCPNCSTDGTAAANEYLRGYAEMQARAEAARLAVPTPPAVAAAPALPAARPVPAAAPAAPKKRGYGEPNLLMGTVGAVVAALAGMMVWYLIIKLTNIEFGIIAWGVGGLTGFGCRMLGGGYSVKLGCIAGACALVAIVGGEFLATKAGVNKLMAPMIAGAYDERMAYAKRALEAKTDEAIRELLAAEKSDGDAKVTPEAIKPSDIAEFRKELPKLEAFTKGRPTKAEFEREFRERLDSAEMNALILKHSVSLWTALWLFLGVGSAYRLGTGTVQ
jgi:hypothetical protein